MQVNGITWHATVVEADRFDSMRTLATETMGLSPMMEFPGVAVFGLPDGTLYELYTKGTEPPFGYNDDGIAFGLRVDDIEAASSELEAAGPEILSEVNRAEMDGKPYTYRHFRAPNGRVYGLNQLG